MNSYRINKAIGGFSRLVALLGDYPSQDKQELEDMERLINYLRANEDDIHESFELVGKDLDHG